MAGKDNEALGTLKDNIRKTIQEIKGLSQAPKPTQSGGGIADDKAKAEVANMGIGRPRSPLMEGIYQTAKTAGQGVVQGASLLNYGLAGASDYALGTKFLPGANQAVKQSFGIQEPPPPEKWQPVGTMPPKPQSPVLLPTQQPASAPAVGGITPAPQQAVAPIAEADKSEPLKRWVGEDGVINITGKNLGIKKPEVKTPVSTGDIEKDIGTRIESLSSDPANRGRSGGLLRSVQNEIGELQRSLLTAKVEGIKTKEHAETNRIGRESIAESKKESLAAKKEQAFVNELKAFGTKKMNPATGESDLNYTPYLFKVAMTSPDRMPDAFKADADAAVKRFDGFVADWEKNPKSGKAGKKASPEERKGLYELYLNKLSQ